MKLDSLESGFVGQAVARLDGAEKVTGRARYAGDVTLPGMLTGRCLRSPYPSARIVSIDTTHARRLPGVHAVLTGEDVPSTRYGRVSLDIPILAQGAVRFVGDKVAAVAAESAEIAEAALSLIEVQYEEAPAVFDAVEAMRDDAPRVHDSPAKVSAAVALGVHGDLRMYPPIPNVVSQLLVNQGNATEALAGAYRIFEHTFTVPSVHQGYIEPHSSLVAVGQDGDVDVWISNKSPHVARMMMADAIGVTTEHIRVNPVMIGGDFGGKGSLMDAALCYQLALHTRRPVRMVMNYFEELTSANPRHAATITLRTGLGKDGRIAGMSAKMIFNCGAYAGFCPVATIHGYVGFAGPYRVPNCSLEVLRVHTNTVPAGHMRSPGAPQITFAVESHFDMIAHELQLNPFEFRSRNAIADGDLSPIGERRQFIRCGATIDAAMEKWDWSKPRAPNVGRGIGLYEYPPGTFGRSIVTIAIAADGAVTLTTGAPDTGTGFHTVVAQLAADLLRVPLSEVRIIHGDTASSGFETGPSGSRLTTTIHQAINAAATEAQTGLRTLAAEYLGCNADAVRPANDGFEANGTAVALKALMAWAGTRGKAPLVFRGENTSNVADDVTCFAAQIAEVEVDRETGQVQIKRIVTAHDVGRVINPITHQGQIEGGVVQAIGQTMCEHLQLRDGAVVSATLGDYKLPTIMDIPELETVLVSSDGPEGMIAKSIGEMSNVAITAAIANAVYDAVGVRLMELPLSAEKIHRALRSKAVAR